MIGIEQIASYVPERRLSNLERLEQFGISEAFVRDKIGASELPRKAADEETSDMCVRAFEALQGKTGLGPEDVDCIIVCTQNPDEHGLPHTSAVLHGKLGGVDGVAAFDISLGCSGYVYGLSVLASFMSANGLQKGLLFTADPYSKIINPDDKNTSLLFGDAATVTQLGPGPIFSLAGFRFGTRGSEREGLQCVGGELEMNGRAIFNFSMTTVPSQIRAVVESAGLQMDDIDRFVFHQGSQYLLDNMRKRLGLPADKVPSNLAEVGNTVSSSIPLILEGILQEAESKRVLISGFGVGLSWATGLLNRIDGASS